MPPVNLALLTDIHVTEYVNNPANQKFLTALEKMAASNPDYLLILGDIAEENGTLEIYDWVNTLLSQLDFPFFVIPGNHDDSHLMKVVFKNSAILGPVVKNLNDYPCYFIDSSSGFVSNHQVDWLKRSIEQRTPKQSLLFTHYPPTQCACGYIDIHYPMRDTKPLWNKLKSISGLSHIFCGHYHTERSVSEGGKNLYICPSTNQQVSPLSATFKLEHEYPGWRHVIWDGHRLFSSVYYCLPG